MENTVKKTFDVLFSPCDKEGRMSVCSLLNCFMDMAATHSQQMGVGYYDMLARNCCWIAVRTRLRVYERPRLMETIQGESWPAPPTAMKNDRMYRLCRPDGTLLAEGRTEWAVLSFETGRPVRCREFFPEMTFREEGVCEGPFTRFKPLEEPAEEFIYTVRSTDIDTGLHMNNVLYVREILNTFSADALKDMALEELEIAYRRACLEGEKLTICRVKQGHDWRFDIRKPDGETAVQALLRTRLK